MTMDWTAVACINQVVRLITMTSGPYTVPDSRLMTMDWIAAAYTDQTDQMTTKVFVGLRTIHANQQKMRVSF
jgi:hypothetical protein